MSLSRYIRTYTHGVLHYGKYREYFQKKSLFCLIIFFSRFYQTKSHTWKLSWPVRMKGFSVLSCVYINAKETNWGQISSNTKDCSSTLKKFCVFFATSEILVPKISFCCFILLNLVSLYFRPAFFHFPALTFFSTKRMGTFYVISYALNYMQFC